MISVGRTALAETMPRSMAATAVVLRSANCILSLCWEFSVGVNGSFVSFVGYWGIDPRWLLELGLVWRWYVVVVVKKKERCTQGYLYVRFKMKNQAVIQLSIVQFPCSEV
jgi:hypothetical protein